MSLYEQWTALTSDENVGADYEKFWTDYFRREKENYEYILENHMQVVEGKLSELAQKFDMDNVLFTGFIDGINSSLIQSVDLESLTEDSEVKLEIDFEKLYYNMLDARAEWLYGLPQWNDILDEEKRREIKKEFNKVNTAVSNKVGRNDPCPCGSGKKYKKCCG